MRGLSTNLSSRAHDIMQEQLERRLQQLKTEFEAGQKMLADLEAKQTELHRTLLRLSGAIQVLEEELGKVSESAQDEAAGKNPNGIIPKGPVLDFSAPPDRDRS